MADNDIEYLTWYISLDDNRFNASFSEVQNYLQTLVQSMRYMEKAADSDTFAHYSAQLDELYQALNIKMQ